MWDLLRRALSNPEQDTHIDIGALVVEYNHRTKTAFLLATDPATPDTAYSELETHLRRQGYCLVILIPSAPLPRNPGAQ